MRRALALVLLVLWPGAVPAEERSCYDLGPTTIFCGKEIGWKGIASSPLPGTFTFENEEFIFAITVQADHKQSITRNLFDLTVDHALRGMDLRTDQPVGTHRAETVEVIRQDSVEGRRILVASVFEGVEAHFVMDVYLSPRHAWTTQTVHLGPIRTERLMRVHTLAMQEVRLNE